jgi:integrase
MEKIKLSIELRPLFNSFISDSVKRRRLTSSNTPVSASSISSYRIFARKLEEFELKTGNVVRIPIVRGRSQRSHIVRKKFWKQFYLRFTHFLYAKGYINNYVGLLMKILKTFLNWLKNDRGFEIGDYYKQLYVPREEIPVIVLSADQLRSLIFDKELSKKLSKDLNLIRELMIFGCFTGLRYSDLTTLSARNIETLNGNRYLLKENLKTGAITRIKLTAQAMLILDRHSQLKGQLLPYPNRTNFNKGLKRIGEIAGWTWEIGKQRMCHGKRVERMNNVGTTFRFCDI